MRPERDLFEIAIYRVAEDDWSRDLRERLERRREALLRPMAEKGMPIHEKDRIWADSLARHAEKVYGWNYNEVIAWVRVIWDGPGPVIKGYMWQVANPHADESKVFRKQYRRGFTPFPFLGGMPVYKVMENWVLDDQTDSEILQDVREGLVTIVGPEGPLPGRHIDLRAFDGVGPLLRWRRLVGMPN